MKISLRGRPMLPIDKVRNHTLSIRLTVDDRQKLNEAAKKLGITSSKLARQILLKAAKQDP